MRIPVGPWYRCVAVARLAVASLGLWAGVWGGRGTAEEPATKLVLAYDRPLPEAARRALAEVLVVDAETKTPLAGAELLVLNFVDLRFHPLTTGSTGLARFAYAYMDEPTINIEVRREGYVPQRCGWGFEKGDEQTPRRVTIALRRGEEIGGQVVDEEGRPVEGATVVTTVSGYRPGERLKGPLGYEMYYEVPNRTGPDGRWQSSSCPPTAQILTLQLIHPDYVSDGCTTLGLSSREVAIEAFRQKSDRQVMRRGVRLVGRVVDPDGRPVAGVRVVESSAGSVYLPYVLDARTDEDGAFHFHFNPKKKVELSVQARGYEPQTQAAVATAGMGPVEFRLKPAKFVRGRLLDPSGKPVAGVGVFASGFGKHKGVMLRTWTDFEGRFRWDDAPAGAIGLMLSKEGYYTPTPVAFIAGRDEQEVVLRPALSVRLSARDARTGKPIENISVTVGRTNPTSGEFSWDQAGDSNISDGEYRRSFDAAFAPYRFRLEARGFEPFVSRPFRGDEKEVRQVLDLVRKAEIPRD